MRSRNKAKSATKKNRVDGTIIQSGVLGGSTQYYAVAQGGIVACSGFAKSRKGHLLSRPPTGIALSSSSSSLPASASFMLRVLTWHCARRQCRAAHLEAPL